MKNVAVAAITDGKHMATRPIEMMILAFKLFTRGVGAGKVRRRATARINNVETSGAPLPLRCVE
jgi:hypothetical protein